MIALVCNWRSLLNLAWHANELWRVFAQSCSSKWDQQTYSHLSLFLCLFFVHIQLYTWEIFTNAHRGKWRWICFQKQRVFFILSVWRVKRVLSKQIHMELHSILQQQFFWGAHTILLLERRTLEIKNFQELLEDLCSDDINKYHVYLNLTFSSQI